MWCNECKQNHTLPESCKRCGTCLLGEYGYQHGDVEHCIRLVTCLVCFSFNTIEYDTLEHHPEKGSPTVQELEKTFAECWETEGEANRGDDYIIFDLGNSLRDLQKFVNR